MGVPDPATGAAVRRGFGLSLEGWDRRGEEFLGWQSDAEPALLFDAESVAQGGRFELQQIGREPTGASGSDAAARG